MKIEFQGETYYVRFMHRQFTAPGRRRQGETACSIWRGNGAQLGRASALVFDMRSEPIFDGPPIITVATQCSMKDQFCRARGRDIALGRAVKQLFPDWATRDAFLDLIEGTRAAARDRNLKSKA